ncbi:hypothetical protein [Rhodobacter sp. NSM]|uniref:hypothetical protein n=1 Tax=Rhodobacter sp. NSM TaxID=3457501 RepID=UPI003FD5D328
MTMRLLLALILAPLPLLAQTGTPSPDAPPSPAAGQVEGAGPAQGAAGPGADGPAAGAVSPGAPAAGAVRAARGPEAGAVRAAPDIHFDESLNDYPTLARADYIFACLATNGQDRDTMRRCACSIDVIASILPYGSYEKAETILSMRLGAGERANLFRIPVTQADVADLRRAQAEAEMTCF